MKPFLIAFVLVFAGYAIAGPMLPRRPGGGVDDCDAGTGIFSDLDFCMSFEEDSTNCDIESGTTAGNPDSRVGTADMHCDCEASGTGCDLAGGPVTVPEGSEVMEFALSEGEKSAIWDSRISGASVVYLRACVRWNETGTNDSTEDSGFYIRTDTPGNWGGSGANFRWDMTALEGGLRDDQGDTILTSANDFAENEWHQITIMFDDTTSSNSHMALWIDEDSNGTLPPTIFDLDIDGQAVTSDLFEGFQAAQFGNCCNASDVTMFWDVIQLDTNESHLVDSTGNDCQSGF
ncbi:hypothetical protein [uncultured Mediterranean phage]|nr:hypothetical protein [uncultured Mediterranean phage]